MGLVNRCLNFIDELGVPATVFCQKVHISTTAFYAWRNGKLQLSKATTDRIDAYLARFGF